MFPSEILYNLILASLNLVCFPLPSNVNLFAELVVGACGSYSIKHGIHIDQSSTHTEISVLARGMDEPTGLIFVYEIVILFAAGLLTTRLYHWRVHWSSGILNFGLRVEVICLFRSKLAVSLPQLSLTPFTLWRIYRFQRRVGRKIPRVLQHWRTRPLGGRNLSCFTFSLLKFQWMDHFHSFR
jgi:hypothetical protein